MVMTKEHYKKNIKKNGVYSVRILSIREIEKQNKLKKEKPLAFEKFQKYPDKRSKGESTAIVQVLPSLNCNLSCQHCAISCLRGSKNNRVFCSDDMISLTNQMDDLGLASLQISGGEPHFINDLDDYIIKSKPEKFYVQCDTNGLLMTKEKAKHLKSIGLDRSQVSIDSLNEAEHDWWRRKEGSWRKAMEAVEDIQNADLDVQIATYVDRNRLYSEEFLKFLEHMGKRNAPVSVIWPKPVGNLKEKIELITEKDMEYFGTLEEKYYVYSHTSSGYGGLNGGCCSVKRVIDISPNGEVFPCCYFFVSIGNVFDVSLNDVLDKGMKYFGSYRGGCLLSENYKFIEKYVSKTWGKKQPIPIEEIMSLNWQEEI